MIKGSRSEGHKEVVAGIRELLAKLYRSFVAWSSLYESADYETEQEQRREQVERRFDELINYYLPRSVWLEEGTRKKIERFIQKSEELCSEFSAEIDERGYERARTGMARRVSKGLGALKKDVEWDLEAELGESYLPPWWRRIFGIASSG